MLQVARFDPGAPVLELACGTGRMSALLSRMGHVVLAGDIDLSRLPDVRRRLTEPFEQQVTFARLDMHRLPFRDHTVINLTCVNTLHEVREPTLCLRELIRILHHDATLLVAEFNDTGYTIMQRLHEHVYHNDHHRGSISHDEILSLLRASSGEVQTLETPLNRAYIVRRKR
jgi:ubiquinone/menaquinone biosynthesis C-methylase UbiE